MSIRPLENCFKSLYCGAQILLIVINMAPWFCQQHTMQTPMSALWVILLAVQKVEVIRESNGLICLEEEFNKNSVGVMWRKVSTADEDGPQTC